MHEWRRQNVRETPTIGDKEEIYLTKGFEKKSYIDLKNKINGTVIIGSTPNDTFEQKLASGPKIIKHPYSYKKIANPMEIEESNDIPQHQPRISSNLQWRPNVYKQTTHGISIIL